ncbi:HU family DNA-binding protein [Streptomyces sp. NRRL S-241]|uniref:HU family DNA-binding protein n=1 Tax=Streptomyces sp. NRRL S-241 TaxID=1463896 RepID=UPI0004C02987|nr:HU family DNA-binding protein [Streptomyces sp. NRRL S-241]
MNKSELINAMATSAEVDKAEAGKALDAFLAAVKHELVDGGSVRLVGFGTFSVEEHATTGVVPTFRADRSLKEAIKSR